MSKAYLIRVFSKKVLSPRPRSVYSGGLRGMPLMEYIEEDNILSVEYNQDIGTYIISMGNGDMLTARRVYMSKEVIGMLDKHIAAATIPAQARCRGCHNKL